MGTKGAPVEVRRDYDLAAATRTANQGPTSYHVIDGSSEATFECGKYDLAVAEQVTKLTKKCEHASREEIEAFFKDNKDNGKSHKILQGATSKSRWHMKLSMDDTDCQAKALVAIWNLEPTGDVEDAAARENSGLGHGRQRQTNSQVSELRIRSSVSSAMTLSFFGSKGLIAALSESGSRHTPPSRGTCTYFPRKLSEK